MMLTSPAIFLKTGNEKTPGDAPMPIYRRDLRTFFFFFFFFLKIFGGWVKIKLHVPHFQYQMRVVCQFNLSLPLQEQLAQDPVRWI